MKQRNLWLGLAFVVGATWACTETAPADTSHSNGGSGSINPFGGTTNQGGTDTGGTGTGGTGTGGTSGTTHSDASIPDAAPQSDAQALSDAAPATLDATNPTDGAVAPDAGDGG